MSGHTVDLIELFFKYLGAWRRRTPRTHIGVKVPKDSSHRGLSNAALPFDLALDARRRRAPKVLKKCCHTVDLVELDASRDLHRPAAI